MPKADGIDRSISQNDHRPVDIYILGTGIIPGLHLTREAEAALRQSSQVMYVDKSFGIEDLLLKYCKNITNLHASCYVEDETRLTAYRKMAAEVVNAAMVEAPVTFAIYGHPLVYSLPPFMVIAAAEAIGLKVRVIPGISSLDTLFVDLRFDPCTQGVQMYEATDLLLRRRPLQADVPCFIWQIGAVESRLYSTKDNDSTRFVAMTDYLSQFYPRDHPMTAVYSSSMPLVAPTFVNFTLDTISDVAEELHQGVTVFIPPVSVREVEDPELLREMDEAGHLEKITISR